MDTSSYFIENKALFGCFPSSPSIKELEENNVVYFVDLTTEEEKIKKKLNYNTKYTYINYPIKDMYIPVNWISYSKFIIKLCNIIKELKDNEKIYISCIAGFGRSGIVVASILCYMYGYSPREAINKTNIFRNNRKSLKDKYRKYGSPQTFIQKKFIYTFFTPLKFYRNYKYNNTYGFTNFSPHPVYIENLGSFMNAEVAYQTHKNLNDLCYINKQLNVKSTLISKYLGHKIKIDDDWDNIKVNIMKTILKKNF